MLHLSRFGLAIATAGLLVTLAECQQINSAFAEPKKALETADWKTLVNKHGWSVRYPPSWAVETVDADADRPEDAFQPILRGPKGCDELNNNKECGLVQLGSGWRPLTSLQRIMGPKKALLEKVNDSRFVLLQQGDAVLGGQPAYCIVYRVKRYEDYPNGVIFKEIETQYKNNFYFISISEESKDRGMISVITSPDQWRLNATFETIISSFTFTAR